MFCYPKVQLLGRRQFRDSGLAKMAGIGKNGRDLWIWDLGIANTIDKCKSPIEFQRHRSKVMVIEPDFLMPWGLAIGQH